MAVASQGLAAGQSSGRSASVARSESGALLRQPWATDRTSTVRPSVRPSWLDALSSLLTEKCALSTYKLYTNYI